MHNSRIATFILSLLLIFAGGMVSVPEAQSVPGLTDQEFDKLSQTPAYLAMRPPQKLNFSDTEVSALVSAAKAAHKGIQIEEIDPEKHYPVVIQVGHFPRTRGSTGSQGALITEQEGAALIATLLSKELTDLKISHVLIGADSYKSGQKRDEKHYFRADIFLSLHLDGSARPCRVGPSLGYNPEFGKEAMQNIGVAVAIALRLNARDFMRDNYTKNLSHFYSYRHSDTQIAEGIIEMSELSCPPDEKIFLTSSEALARNIATGITFMLGERR